MGRGSAIRRSLFLGCLIMNAGISACDGESPGASGGQPAVTDAVWPTAGWSTAHPEDVGMDPAALQRFVDFTTGGWFTTRGMMVIRRGVIVAESYGAGFHRDSRHESYSVAKSFTSAVTGIAIDQGFLSGVDEKVARFYPRWQSLPAGDCRRDIELRHLMLLTSGLQWEENWINPDSFNDARVMFDTPDKVGYVLDKPCVKPPGTAFTYSTGDPALLSGVIAAATGMTAEDFARKNLFGPIGICGIQWNKDAAGQTITAFGLQGTVREFAKFGYLFLRKGQWEDQQILSRTWVEQTTSPADEPGARPDYSYLWHLGDYNQDGERRNYFYAEGVYGQYIVVLPDEDIVLVKVADSMTDVLTPFHISMLVNAVVD